MRLNIKILNKTWNNIKLNLKEIILFEMLYKLLVFLIFSPLISYIMRVSLYGMGFFNLTNNQLINLGLKIPGIIGIIVIIILAFIAIFIEIGVLTYIANMSHGNKKASITNGLISTLKRLPSTLGIYILPILMICIVMGPIGGIGLSGTLIKNISIPLFIKVELLRTDYGKIFLIAIILISILISLRWILFLPITIIEKVSLKEALIRSKQIYKKQKLNIMKYLLLWIIINIIVRFVPYLIYSSIVPVIVSGEISSKLYLFIFIIGYIAISIVTVPFFIMFLVEVYYKVRGYSTDEKNIDDNYKLKNNSIYLLINKNKGKVAILVSLLFVVMVFATSFNSIYKNTSENNVKVTAHRGFNEAAPENSISSIQKAVEFDADYAEIDVMTTKDNQVVVFHDPTTKRFDNNNTKIKDMTLEEVKKVDIGKYFDIKVDNTFGLYKGETIPTLEEVLKEFKGKIKFNIELKPNGKNDTLENEVAKLLKKYDMEEEVVISSLDYNSIEKFKNEQLDIKVGYILTFGVGDFTKLDVDFISVEYGMLTSKLTDTMHKLGKEVHVWTLNEESEILHAVSLGADNIITDNVWGCIATLQSTESILWLYYNIGYILKYINI